MNSSDGSCFFPEPNDSQHFGCSVVVNKKYLAVGDIGANKVIIYTPDGSHKWSRSQEILPPIDLALGREGSVFGNGLELDGDTLTISGRTKNPPNKIAFAHLPRLARIRARYSGWRYSINLKTGTELNH